MCKSSLKMGMCITVHYLEFLRQFKSLNYIDICKIMGFWDLIEHTGKAEHGFFNKKF